MTDSNQNNSKINNLDFSPLCSSFLFSHFPFCCFWFLWFVSCIICNFSLTVNWNMRQGKIFNSSSPRSDLQFFLLATFHTFNLKDFVSWWKHPLYDMEGDIGGSEHQNTAKNLANSAILPRKSLNTTILHYPSLPMSCQNHHSVHYIWSKWQI